MASSSSTHNVEEEVYENFVVKCHRESALDNFAETEAKFGSCFFLLMRGNEHYNAMSTKSIVYDNESLEVHLTYKKHIKREIGDVPAEDEDAAIITLDPCVSINSNIAYDRVPLGHPLSCPALHSHFQQLELPQKELRVGVCIIIEHLGHILLTRRAKFMRTFPWKWVFPGGHVNIYETLEEAGIRETEEETGLKVGDAKLFAMWESCYPTFLDIGPLAAHHLVVYYTATIIDPENKFKDKLPIPNEDGFTMENMIDGVIWLNKEHLSNAFKGTPCNSLPTLYTDSGSIQKKMIRKRNNSHLALSSY